MTGIPTHFIAKQAAADTNFEIFFHAEILLRLILWVMNIFQSNFFGTKCKKTFKGLTPDKPEITNYKHHLILKLGQINSKLQYPNLK
jgi:hypothetical protein